jgi:hypothetical protein
MAYAKYLALHNTSTTITRMSLAGTWKHRLPTSDDIIEVFMSKTAYFSNHKKIFPLVPKYPAMEKWLLAQDDSPSDAEIWKYDKPTFVNLKKILANHVNTSASTPKGKGKGKGREKEKGKGKGKGKVPQDDSPSSQNKSLYPAAADKKGKGKKMEYSD